MSQTQTQFSLPKLSYNYQALEPHIDAKTMEIHHSKHHQGYVDKLNKALDGHDDLLNLEIHALLQKFDKLPEDVKTPVRKHGGGHANHSLFWRTMSPQGGGQPSGALLSAIEKQFESFDNFKSKFKEAATGQFGSGWAWLLLDGDKLKIESTPNQDSPWMKGKKPILGADVWEHAYYLKHQNKRGDWIDEFWNVVDWSEVAKVYDEVKR